MFPQGYVPTQEHTLVCDWLHELGEQLLRVSGANEVPIASHLFVTSTTFKQI